MKPSTLRSIGNVASLAAGSTFGLAGLAVLWLLTLEWRKKHATPSLPVRI